MLRRLLPSLVATVLVAAPAAAAAPATVAIQGTLLSTSGVGAPDGLYDVTFKLFDAESNGKELWTEGVQQVGVKGGLFTHALGGKKPFDAKTFAGATEVWVSVQFQGEPELPRRKLHAVPFALRAGLADGLDCTGCVTLQHLDPAVLKDYAKTAELAKVAVSGAYADLQGGPDLAPYPKLSDLADVAKSGQYGDLKGVPVLAKVGASCGTGLVVKGIKADGSHECVQAMDPSALPPDGLDEISGGLLFNQFTDVTGSAKVPIKIPDHAASGVEDTIDVPDFGLSQGITINVHLTNSDHATVALELKDPAGAKYELLKMGTLKTKGELKLAWPPTALVSGKLDAWNGKNPAGKWTLKVIDDGYLNNQTDGELLAWSVGVKTLSTKKVGLGGGLQWYKSDTPPVQCDLYQVGFTYLNSKEKALHLCTGKEWLAIVNLVPVGTLENPGQSCKDILAKNPASKDGGYYVAGPGGKATLAFCDMTYDGGGWTLVMRMANNGTLGWSSGYWEDDKLFNEAGDDKVDPTLNSNAKFGAYMTVPGAEIRGCWKGGYASSQCVRWAILGNNTASQLWKGSAKNGGPMDKGTAVSIWGNDPGQPNCNGTGINNYSSKGGYGTYSGARWGVVGNNEGDCATTDSGWGWGTYGSSGGTACGCGLAAWSVSSNCTQGSMWVR
jgi:subtilisin-like proprotein convertase family protein